MEIETVEKLLFHSKFRQFIGTLQNVSFKNHIYRDLYKIGNKQLGFFSLKIRKNNQYNVVDSINHLKMFKDTEGIINKNIEIIEKENFIVIISEWLNGKQPIDNDRDQLPVFFSKLAIFNKNNIINGPYTSMYHDHRYFDSIEELINFEANYNKNYFAENMDSKIILEVLNNLYYGVACIINEDMNCGNLFITNEGKFKIIDTEWIVRGLNLFQFQHFDYFGFKKKEWHSIADEAKNCYIAYFDELGLSNEQANEQIRAVELLNLLRQNTYLKYFGKEEDTEIEKRIKIVLGHKKYI